MQGPKISPRDAPMGFGRNDSHLVVNDEGETCKAFDSQGKMLWKAPARAKGVNGNDWRYKNADTPPGLYLLGQIYNDYERWKQTGHIHDYGAMMSFGWITFDMVDLEGQEVAVGRGGICLHGGGSVHGFDQAWDPRQPFLARTHGCVRMHNEDLLKLVLPLYKKGLVYVSVYQ